MSVHEEPRNLNSSAGLSRREILVGVAAASLIAGAPSLAKATERRKRPPNEQVEPSQMPVHRYMAASAALSDGRILIAGGFGRRWTNGSSLPPLNTTVLFDPYSGQWSAAAPMLVARARHAAVALPDGRIAMIGGFANKPTASVEIYDPQSDTWELTSPLSQPRYDHSAVYNGDCIVVLGGSSQSIVTGVEIFRPDRKSLFSTEP